MTCIVGIARDGTVHLGADSVGADVHTYQTDIRKDPKVFRNGEFIMGYTSSFRMGDILQYRFAPPVIDEGVSLAKYMRTAFVDAVRATFKEGGFATKTNDQEAGGTFMVGVRGRLFVIDNDYQVWESMEGWAAVGSGTQIARGAMFALLQSSNVDIPSILVTALKAAEYCSAYVRGPFHIISTDK